MKRMSFIVLTKNYIYISMDSKC